MIYPEPYTIQHYQFVDDAGEDAHGNPIGHVSDVPVPRKVICFYPRNAKEPVSPDTISRYETELRMLVKTPEVYGSRDEVDIVGNRFEVVGPGADSDWRNGPWKRYSRLFGGALHLRRIG
ncbi:Uncharacterised protein [Mycobacteroides abscessus subsp. massiliense]|uniref:hypothetical protein n=1 Tax=Mycobacteroides abscessus TaxID=36809 RepID=UPI0009A8974C|nr:hypothetical protein [Mycobacteroides abscessus]SKM81057.1 Uncharacterised protein [Mycobacteroides abscessus subsp. massiliense]SKM97498.1 Uncharacterised protein [Mycobacteroides abscessus subsp. massiliense]SKN76397.1 Uncharacterised protein [Mycobacteroides abscessus subsp. massiliense]SKN96740.1 Uncharacterised protein [Mycobacteroides abscessus subsp. massiliense]SKO21066.1 Uncharacterised protein [Mycobacteroides abscessus subsp. massiliense]